MDFIDESEVLTPADEAHHVDKWGFKVPFVPWIPLAAVVPAAVIPLSTIVWLRQAALPGFVTTLPEGFGQPLRITATARLGAGEVVDIEREVDQGGPIHSKGVLILTAYLKSLNYIVSFI